MQQSHKVRSYLQKINTFVLLILLCLLFSGVVGSQLWSTTAIAILSAGLISSIRPDTQCYRFLSSKPVVYIGKISYSLYLWHWTIITIGRWTIGISYSSLPVIILLTMMVSMASYHYIETPFRHAQIFKRKYLNIVMGVVALITTAIVTGLEGIYGKTFLFLGKVVCTWFFPGW